MEFYWQLELYGGEIIKVKPDKQKIKYIQDLIAKQEGAITTPTRSIVIKDIKDFRLSDEVYTDQKLIEGSSQAFGEPIWTPEGAIAARMVKKSVPRRKWDNYFKYIPSYRRLSDNDNFVTVAFKLPVHLIDHTQVEELSQDEERVLAR